MDLRTELGVGVTSVDAIRALTGVSRPASLKDILARYREPIVFDEPLVTPSGVALGGHHTITLQRDGTVSHQGHMRATGFPSFTFGVRTVVGNDAGIPLVFGANGRVHGTNEAGDRESAWNQTDHNGLIALHWAQMKRARPQTDINRDADFFGTISDVVGFAATLAAGGLIAGPAGACLMLGVRAADIAGPGAGTGIAGLAGVTVAAGTLIVLGPGAFVPAIVAGAAAGTAIELSLKHRTLTATERAFADRVFKGTVPFDRVILTNLLAPGGRAFTIPSVGNSILLNLGAGFDDPVRYAGFGDPQNPAPQAPGQLLIHELVHAWQISTTTFLPGLVCDQIRAQLGGHKAYLYGAPDQPYGTFNPEQRAKIVDNWFAGNLGCATEQGAQCDFPPMDESEDSVPGHNPYFHYVSDNIRRRLP